MAGHLHSYQLLVFGVLILAICTVAQAWTIHRLQVRVYDLEDAQPRVCLTVEEI